MAEEVHPRGDTHCGGPAGERVALVSDTDDDQWRVELRPDQRNGVDELTEMFARL